MKLVGLAQSANKGRCPWSQCGRLHRGSVGTGGATAYQRNTGEEHVCSEEGDDKEEGRESADPSYQGNTGEEHVCGEEGDDKEEGHESEFSRPRGHHHASWGARGLRNHGRRPSWGHPRGCRRRTPSRMAVVYHRRLLFVLQRLMQIVVPRPRQRTWRRYSMFLFSSSIGGMARQQ